jgi:hypothetical protein
MYAGRPAMHDEITAAGPGQRAPWLLASACTVVAAFHAIEERSRGQYCHSRALSFTSCHGLRITHHHTAALESICSLAQSAAWCAPSTTRTTSSSAVMSLRPDCSSLISEGRQVVAHASPPRDRF